jgi:phosphatidylethanolamine-binding protein (PEBP) family uncharacterized protein
LAVSCGSSGRDLPAPLAGVAAPTRSSEAGAAGASGASASASAGGGLQLVASAFAPGGPVPPEYGCDGPAPELTWSGKLPDGTNELALVARDPQTGSVHWFVAGISAGAHTSPKGGTPENVAQLVNSAGKNGYAGPCPPPGEVKRIEFSVVALSGSAALPVTTAAADAWARIQPKVLGRAVLEGAFTGVTPPAAPQ